LRCSAFYIAGIYVDALSIRAFLDNAHAFCIVGIACGYTAPTGGVHRLCESIVVIPVEDAVKLFCCVIHRCHVAVGIIFFYSYFLLLGDKRKYAKKNASSHCYRYIRSTAGAQRASSPALTTMSCNGCLQQAALSCTRILIRRASLPGCPTLLCIINFHCIDYVLSIECHVFHFQALLMEMYMVFYDLLIFLLSSNFYNY